MLFITHDSSSTFSFIFHFFLILNSLAVHFNIFQLSLDAIVTCQTFNITMRSKVMIPSNLIQSSLNKKNSFHVIFMHMENAPNFLIIFPFFYFDFTSKTFFYKWIIFYKYFCIFDTFKYSK